MTRSDDFMRSDSGRHSEQPHNAAATLLFRGSTSSRRLHRLASCGTPSSTSTSTCAPSPLATAPLNRPRWTYVPDLVGEEASTAFGQLDALWPCVHVRAATATSASRLVVVKQSPAAGTRVPRIRREGRRRLESHHRERRSRGEVAPARLRDVAVTRRVEPRQPGRRPRSLPRQFRDLDHVGELGGSERAGDAPASRRREREADRDEPLVAVAPACVQTQW